MRGLWVATFLASSALLASEARAPAPQFAEGNQLLRPEGYREWVFLGSGWGMSYNEKAYDEAPDFTNVFIKPEAYRAFIQSGEFPDGTVLVLEIRKAGSLESINKHGQFQDRLVGIEASVKDEKRFPEKWAYFSFIGKDGEALPQAKPFPKDACWKCHNEHAVADNVFLQFYPALREARASAPK
jgi:hypothetical protein